MPIVIGGKRVQTQHEASAKVIAAARWRGTEIVYLEGRIRRLAPIRERLIAWCDANPDHRLWHHRNHRAITIWYVLQRFRDRINCLIVKVDDLVKGKPLAIQEQITRAYFDALHSPPPAHRPPAIMEDRR